MGNSPAEHMLQRLSRQGLIALIDAVLAEFSAPLWLVSSTDSVILANRQAREIGRSDNTDRFVFPMLHGPGGRIDLVELARTSLAGHEPLVLENVELTLAERLVHHVDLRVVPVPVGPNEQIVIIAAALRPEHAELKLQQLQDQSVQSLMDLAARIAHELNNPLDGSLRYINLALRRIRQNSTADIQPHKVDEYLSSAKEALDKMHGILSDLVQFARTGHSAMDGMSVSVNELVEQAVKTFSLRAQSAGTSIVTALTDHLPRAGNTRLYQVFCNLIKNAIDAIQDRRRRDPDCPGIVTVKTLCVEGRVKIVCEDSGIGLPADSGHLFEPFFTTKHEQGGTGLGLAIAREIVEECRGRIWSEPRREGGARFIVELPASVDHADKGVNAV